ncbi:MAG: ribonuclease P protein component [Burkholderiaceae bacterium]
MIGRLLRSADFERVLRTRTRVSSTHFAVHHLQERPTRPHKPVGDREYGGSTAELSTGSAPNAVMPVDDFASGAELGLWLGAVVPKRHARRAVTRTLLKRQIRSVVGARAEALLGGLWVVRLRAPFDKTVFPSAASEALKLCAREELEHLLSAAAQRMALR